MAVLVNGEKVDPAEVAQEIERLRPYYDQHVREANPDGGDEQLAEWAMENIIERMLLQQEAAGDAEPVPAEDIDAAFEQVRDSADGRDENEKELRAEIERHVKLQRLLQRISDGAGKPTAEQMRKHYEDNQDQFSAPEQIRASHIVKHIDGMTDHETARKGIEDVKRRLDEGTPFEELAAEHSDCPDQAGDLGCFPRGQMVPEFEEVVFNMEPGQVSDVFLTAFGYHIAKVTDRQAEHVVPFEQVREHIAEELTDWMQKQAMEDFVDKLKAGASIEETPDAKAPAGAKAKGAGGRKATPGGAAKRKATKKPRPARKKSKAKPKS